jgi:hypothetical protein
MPSIAGFETVRFGIPRNGEHYLVLDDEDASEGDLPYANQAMADHGPEATPRVIVRPLPPKNDCPHPQEAERQQTFSFCGECGEITSS